MSGLQQEISISKSICFVVNREKVAFILFDLMALDFFHEQCNVNYHTTIASKVLPTIEKPMRLLEKISSKNVVIITSQTSCSLTLLKRKRFEVLPSLSLLAFLLAHQISIICLNTEDT